MHGECRRVIFLAQSMRPAHSNPIPAVVKRCSAMEIIASASIACSEMELEGRSPGGMR